MSSSGDRRLRREALAAFYQEQQNQESSRAESTSNEPIGVRVSESSESKDQFNINSQSFNADAFTQRLIKEAPLSQLMAQEAEINRQIGTLDSDMQTLVYENYNKFIAATDTIRKMRVDFRAMEDEMDQLASKMTNINMFSGQISESLRDRRQKIGQLSGTHALLKKLQFLFELPAKLKECIEEDDLATGVRYYLRAQKVLDQYENMASFRGIKNDCDAIMRELREKLNERLRDPATVSEDSALCVELLLRLDAPAEELCDAYLDTAKSKLEESLVVLDRQIKLASSHGNLVVEESGNNEETSRPSDAFEARMDVLEFVDYACNTFIGDLSLVIASYNEIFMKNSSNANAAAGGGFQMLNTSRDNMEVDVTSKVDENMANEKLAQAVNGLMDKFFERLKARFKLDTDLDEVPLRVRALDRFHRRLQAMCRLLVNVDYSRAGLDIVLEASEQTCKEALKALKTSLDEALLETRKRLAIPSMIARKVDRLEVGDEAGLGGSGQANLAELNTEFLKSIAEEVRKQTKNLEHFIDPELTFSLKTYFRAKFCRYLVREGVVVAYFGHIIDVTQNFCTDTEKSVPPTLLLLLSRTCYDLQLNTTHYLLNGVDEQFFIDNKEHANSSSSNNLTGVAKINDLFKTVSQMLLNQYAKLEGGVLSQMLRKSVETRDWLNSVEPRTVRAVMKRVVEETTAIERRIGTLYEEGTRTARSSDSSRRHGRRAAARSITGTAASTPSWGKAGDTSIASNIQKMFVEKIEIFSAVEFSKISILTGIVKIALKTLLECVRLRTFSKFGFQQMQVDCHYLQLYMWRFVSDENLVIHLLDEVMTSAVYRCAEPVPMEPSVVDVICDKS